jgi:hypothetical protein
MRPARVVASGKHFCGVFFVGVFFAHKKAPADEAGAEFFRRKTVW